MPSNSIPNGHINKLIEAFKQDNFDVDENKGILQFERKVGIVATHKTAINSNSKEKKKAYYVEGNHYQMGYLMGLMAEQEIAIDSYSGLRYIARMIAGLANGLG